MKLILAQPAIQRFQWETEVLLTNLRNLDGFDLEPVLLFTEQDWTVPNFIREKYPEASVHQYSDTRGNRQYIPSVRPHLWQQYLREDRTREQEDYLYVDSDILFREWLDFSKLSADPNTWSASECKGYVDYEYIRSRRNGEAIAERMAAICGITMEQLRAAPGVGAQWVMKHPTAEYWDRVERDCNELYGFFNSGDFDSDLQTWTADMWAHLYGAIRMGKEIELSREMDFCVATDPVEKYDEVKIYHNAGVTNDLAKDHFFKGQYKAASPFNDDLSHVRTDKATIKYVQALRKVTQ